jgi:hypothetical protein
MKTGDDRIPIVGLSSSEAVAKGDSEVAPACQGIFLEIYQWLRFSNVLQWAPNLAGCIQPITLGMVISIGEFSTLVPLL